MNYTDKWLLLLVTDILLLYVASLSKIRVMGERLTQLVYLYAGAIVLDAWFKTIEADDSKSFRTMALRNGSNLCAFDPPSLLLSADQLGLHNASTSASLAYICAWQCTRQTSCVSFSWDSCRSDCLLYFYAPQRCFYKIGCSHFEVRNFICHMNWCYLLKVVRCSLKNAIQIVRSSHAY